MLRNVEGKEHCYKEGNLVALGALCINQNVCIGWCLDTGIWEWEAKSGIIPSELSKLLQWDYTTRMW